MKSGTMEHPKTHRLARTLGIMRCHAGGVLECLWLFAGKFRPDGDLTGYSADDIAAGIYWEPKDEEPTAEALIEALVACKWLDHTNGRLVIHDYARHAPQFVKRRAARERAQAGDRESEDSQTQPMAIHGQSAANQGATVDSTSNQTQPNQTQPNQTQPNPTKPDAPAARRVSHVGFPPDTCELPTLDEVRALVKEIGAGFTAEDWYDHYMANGWQIPCGNTTVPMQDWRASVRRWNKNGREYAKSDKCGAAVALAPALTV